MNKSPDAVSEIEAAVLDYQRDAMRSSCASVERRFLARQRRGMDCPGTATLAKQLPAPSVPTKIFLVEKFVMKPVSGKIDRKCLPNLSHLLGKAEPEAEDTRQDISAATRNTGEVKPPDADAGMDHECEEVLAICGAVFETPLGLDDGFADAGGHSILIARLAQRLQAAGWTVSVRALLSDCNTARKVANRPRVLQSSQARSGPVKSDPNSVERDEAAAEVLSVGHFTTLQVLFAILLYFPGLVVFLSVFGFADVGTFFTTARLSEFIIVSFLLYLLLLVLPFASLFWVMTIKLFMSGDIYKNNVTPGMYPKWSKMHLRIWCIGRMENTVLLPLGAMYRSAPLMAFVLRQLGALGQKLQCATMFSIRASGLTTPIGDNVAFRPGLVQIRDGQPIPARRPGSPRKRLQNRDASRHRQQCDRGPRHLDHSVHPDPQRRGPERDVGRSARAPQRPLHGAKAHGGHLPVCISDLVTRDSQRSHAGRLIFLFQSAPHRRDLVARSRVHTRFRS